jgi:Phosphate-selective porin O and P
MKVISPRRHLAAACALVNVIFGAAPADAQLVIKASEDVRFTLGVLGQFQAETLDNPEPDENTNNLFIRRVRLLFGGQVAKNVSFFIETDSPNLGRTLPAGKNITPTTIIQDAYASFRVGAPFTLEAGLMFVPFSRNSIQSAGTLLPIDYGAYTFTQSAPLQNSTGRDTGFQARGYFLDNHLEYRLGVFQGRREPDSANSFRWVGRGQYNVFETETGFFYSGTYLGRRRVLALGAAFDRQSDYQGYAADVFLDWPLGPGAFTGRVDYRHFDGGTTVIALLEQDDVLLEAGYLFRALSFTPVLQWDQRDVSLGDTGDETRTSIGANYWWSGHNANIKFAYMRIAPAGLGRQHAFTLQFQIFYF